MKKKLPLILISIVVLGLGIGGFLWLRGRGQSDSNLEAEPEKTKITEPVNVIPVSDRPYLKIVPNRAHYVSIMVGDLKKEAELVEYELEYQSGSLLQGAFGEFELESLPAEREIMLGTCSAGGACTYHEDIKGGTLLTRFGGGPEAYALKNDWRYFENDGTVAEVSSRDAKFQLSSEDLEGVSYIIVTNSPGAPLGLEKEVISDVYVLAGSSELSGAGELSIRANSDTEGASIYGYDGTDWTEFNSSLDGKQVTAEVELMSVYVAAQ